MESLTLGPGIREQNRSKSEVTARHDDVRFIPAEQTFEAARESALMTL